MLTDGMEWCGLLVRMSFHFWVNYSFKVLILSVHALPVLTCIISLCYGLENALALDLSVWIQPQMQFPLLSSKISLQSTLAALSLYQLWTSTSLQFFSFFFVKRLQLCQVAWRSWALGHKFSVMDVQRVFDSSEKQTCVRNTALWLLSLSVQPESNPSVIRLLIHPCQRQNTMKSASQL